MQLDREDRIKAALKMRTDPERLLIKAIRIATKTPESKSGVTTDRPIMSVDGSVRHPSVNGCDHHGGQSKRTDHAKYRLVSVGQIIHRYSLSPLLLDLGNSLTL
jgi:hypothetical protein